MFLAAAMPTFGRIRCVPCTVRPQTAALLLAGGMMAANIIAPRMSRRRGGPRAAQNTRLVARGATAMVSVGQNRSAEVGTYGSTMHPVNVPCSSTSGS